MLSGLLEYWLARLPAERVHYVHLAPRGVEVAGAVHPVHQVVLPQVAERLARLAWHVVVRRDRSIQESLLRGRRTRRTLTRVLDRIGADLEIYDTVRLAQFAPSDRRDGVRRVVYLDDLFSVRYARMVQTMRERPDLDLNVLGEFATLVPRPLRALIRRRAVQSAVLGLEGRLVARSEDAAARAFPLSLLVSETEAQALVARTGAEGVAVMRPRVKEAAPVERRYDGRPEFVFLGLLTLPHNAVAVRVFLEGPMRELLRRVPSARLRIVGRGAGEDLRALVAGFAGSVTLEGFVEDLDGLLAGACAMVNPLLFGTGVKLKVVEALSRGLPVLSTAIGAEGVTTGRQQGCVVEDDLSAYPDRMVELLDHGVNAALSDAARRHYQAQYATSAVYAAYDRLFDASRPVPA